MPDKKRPGESPEEAARLDTREVYRRHLGDRTAEAFITARPTRAETARQLMGEGSQPGMPDMEGLSPEQWSALNAQLELKRRRNILLGLAPRETEMPEMYVGRDPQTAQAMAQRDQLAYRSAQMQGAQPDPLAIFGDPQTAMAMAQLAELRRRTAMLQGHGGAPRQGAGPALIGAPVPSLFGPRQ